MTFCIAPIIDVVNITFAILASRSLHIAQQESHVNALVSTLTAMLDVTIVDQGESDDEQHESFKSMRIPQVVDAREIVKYTITVIRGLMSIQAEHDDANKPLQADAPPCFTACGCATCWRRNR
ncbi:hypothetical protein H257_19292 [Aphanomyces astaci]|uniref:Uncharacterized protein n=1 Tax=Aphanomyces astaci TaxID=112090 RepID=W4FAN7_APHAT|nr:hypothetical protein H257_19292 [Aphanomyces astaci]ETV63778.1 hypothetical protein H257_19292 [Aphanomyces astaci]|eukprot:XP_009846739.1 hypothetical protein H257_19292 [Aphanomyces astaci]